MLRKIAVFLIAALVIQVFSYYPAKSSVTFRDLAARSAIIAEKDTGLVLYESNSHIRHPADALTKIMTLYIAAQMVENDDISDHELITMTETAWYDINDNSTTQDILPGEEMTFIDLMYSAYVGNANEACNMLALRISGSIDAFVRLMNEQAKEMGADNTQFMNAHGQYNDSQYTTAHDQFLIFSTAMKSALFTEVSSTFRHITEGTDEVESRTITNSNSLLNQSSRYFYRHCISGRDSATYEGGYSLVALAEEDGLALVSVVLGSDVIIFDDESTDMRNFSESLRLFQWAFTQFAWRDILKTTDLLARVPILHGSGADFVNARPESSLTLLLDNSIPLDSFIQSSTIFYDENNPLVAPVSAGDVLGEVIVTRNGVEYAKIALVANTNVSLSGVEYIRGQIVDLLSTNTARNILFILAAILILYIALVIRYNIVRANRIRKIKNAKDDIVKERHQNFRDN
ncbi:MAG: serine hydrolase [Oscillospiraceae bacterium]|nr:serine hydrolase [Oscillospiraceae bacterium]